MIANLKQPTNSKEASRIDTVPPKFKWAMIFLPPKSWFQELSSSRKTTFTPDSLRHHRRTSLQRSFNTRRSVSGGLGLAKRSKLRGQELKAQLIYFFGVPANAWKLIHNLACKVSRTRRWPVTIVCLKQNMSFWLQSTPGHITKTKTNLAWASPTPGWQESTRNQGSLLWLAGSKTCNFCFLPSHPEFWLTSVMLIQKLGDHHLGCIIPFVHLVG